jgi:hypothetical protein
VDKGEGVLELILFVTSTGAIYICFSAGASRNTGWRAKRVRVEFIQGHAAFSWNPKTAPDRSTSRMGGGGGVVQGFKFNGEILVMGILVYCSGLCANYECGW